MNDFMARVVEISLQTSIVLTIYWLLRKLLQRHLNPIFRSRIWFVLMILLALPIHIESKVSLDYVVESRSFSSDLTQNKNFIYALPTSQNVEKEKASSDYFLLIYLVAVFTNMAYVLFQHLYLRRGGQDFNYPLEALKKKVGYGGPVKVKLTFKIGAPAVMGFFSPIILLPRGMLDDLSKEDLEYIFIHELTHLKQKDNLLNLFLIFYRKIFWFNPFNYLCSALIRQDIEYACDYKVKMVLNQEERRQYGHTLLNLVTLMIPSKNNLVLPLINKKRDLKERIQEMINIKKYSAFLMLSLMTGLLLLSCSVIADYKEEDKTESNEVSIVTSKNSITEKEAEISDLKKMTFEDANKIIEANDGEELKSYLMHKKVEYYDHLFQLTHDVTVYPLQSQEESSALYAVMEGKILDLYIDEYNGSLGDDRYESTYVIKHGPESLVSKLPEQVNTIEDLRNILDMNHKQYVEFIYKQEGNKQEVFLFSDGQQALAFLVDGDLVKNRLFDLSYNQVDLSILFWDNFYSETAKNFDYATFRQETMTVVSDYFPNYETGIDNFHPIDMGDYYLVLVNSTSQVKISKDYEVFYMDNTYSNDQPLENPLNEAEALEAVQDFIKLSPLNEKNYKLNETLFEYEFNTQNKEYFIFELSDSNNNNVYIKYNAFSGVVDSVWFTVQ